MKAMTNSEFAEFADGLAGSASDFEPTAAYDPDGDCIEFVFANDDFYAERIDDIVTVYYSRANKELIGSLIKNVSKIKKNHPSAFAISVEDGKVRLQHFFVAAAASADTLDEASIYIYKKLAKAAEDSGAEAQVCFA